VTKQLGDSETSLLISASCPFRLGEVDRAGAGKRYAQRLRGARDAGNSPTSASPRVRWDGMSDRAGCCVGRHPCALGDEDVTDRREV
jgi:hypothetical protein